MMTLRRKVAVYSFDFAGTVSLARKRDELLAVAELAGKLGPLTGTVLARELLGQAAGRLGERLLAYAIDVGLLYRPGRAEPAHLTEQGRVALASGHILEPEEGVWRIYWADDLLLDQPLVHVARLSNTQAKDDRLQLRAAKEKGQPNARPTRLPVDIQEACTGTWTSRVDDRAVRIDNIQENGARGPDATVELCVAVAKDDSLSVRLRGLVPAPDGKPLNLDAQIERPSLLADLTGWDIWRVLVHLASSVPEDVLASWRERVGRLVLPVRFDANSTPDALRIFKLDLSVTAPDLGELGRFDALMLKDVPIVPRTAADAHAWATWLLWDGLDSYATPKTLADLQSTVATRFPWYRIEFPSVAELLQSAVAQPLREKSRFLLAPADLGLWSAP